MSHPFGDLLRQYRARKAGLTQSRLAELAGYDRTVLGRMAQGQKDLTGPSGRERLVRIMGVLHQEGALTTLDEANALLKAAGMPPLYEGAPDEVALIKTLRPGNGTTFGEFLKFLRRRMQMTQQEVGLALDYSAAMIARLESGERLPDLALVKTTFIEALGLEHEPQLAARLIELAATARGEAQRVPASAPALHATHQARPPGNLPRQLTRFIGRERAMAEVAHLLDTNRLVTLTGSGGVGKTRLAIEVGTMHHPSHRDGSNLADGAPPLRAPPWPDGVWLVELAPLSDPALIPSVTAGVFGLRDQAGRTTLQALVAYLEDKQLLLLLDNCEHLIQACAELAEALLRACPHVRILATSREALHVPGEVTWLVPSLSIPDLTHLPTLEHVLDYEAVQLFVEHAAAARSEFKLSPENVIPIAQVCQRLDGIPLAIEMAAAQAAAMTPLEIASKLDDRFTLLTSGQRTARPRHQTLRAAIEWSYQLLSEPERLLLARLSVFAGGCLADAAQAVCSEQLEAGDPQDVLPLLLQLVHKSLAVADTEWQRGQTRYRLLETVRQFAAEKLGASERETLNERHIDFLVHLGTWSRREMLVGVAKTNWLLRLEAELGNIRALLQWARHRQDDGVASLKLAAGVYPLWVAMGHQDEGRDWLEDALARGSAAPAAVRLPALGSFVQMFVFHSSDIDRVEAIADEYMDLARGLNDQWHMANALELLGAVAFLRGNPARRLILQEQSLSLFRELHDFNGAAEVLDGLGKSRLRQGDWVKAVDNLEEAIALGRLSDNLATIYSSLLALSIVDPQRARALCEQVISDQRASAHERGLAQSLLALGQMLIASSDYTRAEQALVESHDLWQRMNVQVAARASGGTTAVLLELARAAVLQGQYELALERFRVYLSVFRVVGYEGYIANTHLWWGYAALAVGDYPAAAQHLGESLRRGQSTRPMALAGLARLSEVQGDASRAARLYGAAAAQEPMVRSAVLTNTAVSPVGGLFYDRDIAAARSRLSDPEWAAAWVEGQAMTIDQAVAYALETAPGPT